MNSLVQYGSDSEEEAAVKRLKTDQVDLAPQHQDQSLQIRKDQYQVMTKPLQGPMNPFVKQKQVSRNMLSGHVEEHAIGEHVFDALQRTFVNYGYTVDPDAQNDTQLVGDAERIVTNKGMLVNQGKGVKKKRKPQGDPSDVDGYEGPWAGYEGEQLILPERTAEQESEWKPEEDKEKQLKGYTERTVLHGKQEVDYMGRTYMDVPRDTDVDLRSDEPLTSYTPKTLLHTFTGHTKGVNAVRLFPKSGHMALSCSMDNKVKLWDLYRHRRVLRTFDGHSKGVRDICFSKDGSQFLSASYDKMIKLWDTETGQCVSRFTTKRVPQCIKFHPELNVFLTGCQDKKIYQFDIASGDITQEYDQHLGAVNTITFVDGNRRFITTSDDKTLRAWEYDIPVVIKYVAEPDMHSMPAVSLSHNNKWLACQSLDNQVLIYSAQDKFRQNRKKSFKGHLVAGYACQPSFSPDDRFVASGDSAGKMWFWDWKTCKVVRSFKAHDAVVMGCEWLPHETSKLITCSWDGTLKLWT